jgi:hypothetical protein
MTTDAKYTTEDWLFERCQILGHVCDSIMGLNKGEMQVVAWRDRMTGEIFHVPEEELDAR